jgi:hypothetical protein
MGLEAFAERLELGLVELLPGLERVAVDPLDVDPQGARLVDGSGWLGRRRGVGRELNLVGQVRG